jgi:hypothetical protein
MRRRRLARAPLLLGLLALLAALLDGFFARTIHRAPWQTTNLPR